MLQMMLFLTKDRLCGKNINFWTCHPAEVTLPQPKLVLDLANPEGCKGELTWVTSQETFSCQRRSPVSVITGAVSWLVLESTSACPTT